MRTAFMQMALCNVREGMHLLTYVRIKTLTYDLAELCFQSVNLIVSFSVCSLGRLLSHLCTHTVTSVNAGMQSV